MADTIQLPVVDQYGFYDIRFDSIGGLGAHAASEMLGEAAVLYMGLNALHFSSCGSVKKGSRVRSFLRFSAGDTEIRSCGPIERPHMVVVFHDALVKSKDVFDGLRNGGTLIVNTRKSPSELGLDTKKENYAIFAVDALSIALEEKSRINVAMLGAIAKASGFLDRENVLKALTEMSSRKHPDADQANETAFNRGYNEIKLISESAKEISKDTAEDESVDRGRPQYGYIAAPTGGTITAAGNSVLKDLGISRQGFMPIFDGTKCVICGLCNFVCPDQCLVWRQAGHARDVQPSKVKLIGVDYRYCKGCLRCVEVCPSGALSRHEEDEGLAEKNRVEAFPELSL